MDALIPDKVKDVYKGIEQKALSLWDQSSDAAIAYAISKIKASDIIKSKIEDLKKLERIVTALFIVVMALLIYLSLNLIVS
jgi:hypothetical protein